MKALRRQGISYYNVDLMNMKEQKFVNKISPILEEYLIISGVDDTASICRNLTRQLWSEIKNELSENQSVFNKQLDNSITSLNVKLDNIDDSLKNNSNKYKTFDIEKLLFQIKELKNTFHNSLNELWVNNILIERKESDKLLNEILKEEKNLVFLKGKAGYGKSNVLYEMTKKLEQKGILYLPLRLDRQIPNYNTSLQFGNSLGLQFSPEKLLYKLAKGEKAILILDQLDAIRWTSQHATQAWNSTKQMIERALNYGNLIVIIACRSYDFNNDPQISNWKDNKDYSSINVGELSLTDVQHNIENMGESWSALTSKEKNLLKIPLNLYLFSKIIEDRDVCDFSSEIELFNKYYNQIRIKFTEHMSFSIEAWESILFDIVNKLDQKQVLSISKFSFMNEKAIEGLISLNLLVQNDNNISFFHQSFFDYVFARIFFKSGKNIIEWLKSGEQSLFRREQLRQILKFHHKNNDFTRNFVSDIEDIIIDDSIRFHLKHVTLQVLGNISDPTYLLWEFVQLLLEKEEWEDHVLYEVLLNNENWFDLLYREGVWVKWLSSNNKNWIKKVIRILPNYTLSRPNKIVNLLKPYLGKANWDKNIIEIISRSKITINRNFFDFVLETIREGYFDYNRIYDSENDKKWMAELIGVWLGRQIEISEEKLSLDSIYIDKIIKNPDGLSNDLIQKVSEEAPKEFIEYILPRIKILLKKSKIDNSGFVIKDKIWRGYLDNNIGFQEIKIQDVLLNSMETSLIKVAIDNQSYFLHIVDELKDSRYETIHYLFLNGYKNASHNYADNAIEYICYILENIEEQFIEDREGWGGRVKWNARSVIKKFVTNCSKDNLIRLENVLLSYYESWDFDSIKYRHDFLKEEPPSKWYLNSANAFGRSQYVLISSIPKNICSDKVKRRILELERKFGTPELSQRSKVGYVGSPIEWKAVEHMTDKQWLAAIDEYKLSRKKNVSLFKGGPRELSRLLEQQVHKHGRRFAQLLFKFPVDCHLSYFSAVLKGITKREAYKFDDEKDLVKPTEKASFLQICEVIRFINKNFNDSLGKEVCRAINRLSNKKWPADIIDILLDYTSFPHEDKIVLGEIKNCHDLINNGINLLEGSAALAISSILFNDYNRFNDNFRNGILNLTHSSSISIRSCAAVCCLPILNFDRNLAVDMFLELVDIEDERILGTKYVQRFMLYVYHTHYDKIKNIIIRMIESSNSEVAEFGSIIQIRYWLDYNREKHITKKCINGSEANRIGAAKLFANIFFDDKYFAKIVTFIKDYFNDSSKKVWQEASRVFFNFEGKEVDKLKEILSPFINSLAFEYNHAQMLRALEKGYNLKEIANGIFEIVEKLSDYNSESKKIKHGKYFYSSSIVFLLLKLYDDSSEMYSKDIRKRCLDSIDKLLKVRVGDMIKKLKEIDR